VVCLSLEYRLAVMRTCASHFGVYILIATRRVFFHSSKPHAEMAQYSLYNQGLDTCDGVTEFESIRPSPLSETVPFFIAGARSSTWPMQRNGSHDISCDYTEYQYNGGVNDRIHDTEPEASNSESIKPCEYNQNIESQLLTRRSDLRAHRTP
jgi:hypothetical protein